MFLKVLSIIIHIFRLCASDSTYECGGHGKFEYCIDGIPGCVIGCHCHPGYYFDTDTKICEPNIKLTQDYRRHYLSAEPTRVNLEPMKTSPPNEIVVERITKSLIDQKVDDIAKDADDLGDWLYNQFFKTIENQVINKTNGENLQTRRSGVEKKPVRRSHKKHYRSKKPKRGKKKNLKNKLLRITEDDSLFDSSSSETDTDDDSTSDSSGSSGSSTSDDLEDTSQSSKKKKKHGHKKIVIFNKKPRPPLPSFIFLPNMDTPFFPPIGLPPPGVPMYPMVPVPPVMGPMFPYPGIVCTNNDNGSNCNNGNNDNNANNGNSGNNGNNWINGNNSNNLNNGNGGNSANVGNGVNNGNGGSSVNNGNGGSGGNNGNGGNSGNGGSGVNKGNGGSGGNNGNGGNSGNGGSGVNKGNGEIGGNGNGTLAPTVPEVPAEEVTVDTTAATEKEADSEDDDAPKTLRQRRIKHPLRTRPEFKDNQHTRNKLLQKLRQKMIRKHKLENYIAQQYQDGTQLMDMPPDFEPDSDMKLMEKPPSLHPDVDFKYLTELIHRMDPNDTSKSNIANLAAANEMLPPYRRYFNPNQQYTLYQNAQNKTSRQPQKADDSYYSNLGRQIASMIKNIDLSGDREIDVEIERQNNKNTPIQHVFNENGGYGSRSYWERSVRSPLKYVNEFKKGRDQSVEHLLKLENQVEFAASTERTLSLQELELIISGMKKAQERSRYKEPQINNKILNEPVKSPSKISFNLNLMSKKENLLKKPKTTTKLPLVWTKSTKKEIIGHDLNNFLLSNYYQPILMKEKDVFKEKPTSITKDNSSIQNVFIKPTRQPITIPATKKPKQIWYQPKYMVNIKPSPKTEIVNKQQYNLSPLTPFLQKQYNPNYNSNNNINQFLLEKHTIPVHLQHYVSRRLNPYVNKKNKNPSYFFHEFHHLDYFDE